jgi:hypothetical protein
MGTADQETQVIYWHGQLPPIDAEPAGEHVVEANSIRVKGDLAIVVPCGISATTI